MHTIPRNSRFVQSPPPPDLARSGLVITVPAGRPLVVRQIGLTEAQGIASAALADRLPPQLDRLAEAVKRAGVK